MKLKFEDLSMINHFWGNYQDLEQWTGWEKRKKLLPEEIVNAWSEYKLAKEKMDKIVDNLEEDFDEEKEANK